MFLHFHRKKLCVFLVCHVFLGSFIGKARPSSVFACISLVFLLSTDNLRKIKETDQDTQDLSSFVAAFRAVRNSS